MLEGKKLQNDQEQYEIFISQINAKEYGQYDYRDSTGELFSTVAPNLETARLRRDDWYVGIEGFFNIPPQAP